MRCVHGRHTPVPLIEAKAQRGAPSDEQLDDLVARLTEDAPAELEADDD